MPGVLNPHPLAQIGIPEAEFGARTGSGIAELIDSPEKLALVWIVGGAVLIAVLVLLVKMKKDKD